MRTVLLLQGPASWFFARLARALRARGARVLRVLLCAGDRVFWRGPGAIAYRGRPEGWAAWLGALCRREGVSDIACLGEGRVWHAEAIALAARAGIAVHVIEQGLLRPGWLRVEPPGWGAALPTVGAAGEPTAPDRAPPAPRFRAPFANYAAMDVAWNLANLLGAPFWPHYRRHALDHPLRDWAGWLLKAAGWPGRRRAVARAEARLAAHAGPVFLFALQLEGDFQIRLHGPPGGLRRALADVAASFAAHAPADALLAVKRHPLDNGLAPWRAILRDGAGDAAGRCVFLPGGALGPLLSRARGVVTVNSSVGLAALRAGRPVKVLGRAAYDRPGLTDPQPLTEFWRAPRPPERRAVEGFVARLLAETHVPGGFDGQGAERGAALIADRILARGARCAA